MASVTESVGRSPRSQRTRDAVIDGLHGLIYDGNPSPSARQIAARAGISMRSIYVHFPSLDDLYCAAAERTLAMMAALVAPIDPDAGFDGRVEEICLQRSRINEEVGPLRRAARLQEPFSPALTRVLDNARRASRVELDRVFAAELDPLDRRSRRRRLAALDAALSGAAWDVLRRANGLSADEARIALQESVGRLLR